MHEKYPFISFNQSRTQKKYKNKIKAVWTKVYLIKTMEREAVNIIAVFVVVVVQKIYSKINKIIQMWLSTFEQEFKWVWRWRCEAVLPRKVKCLALLNSFFCGCYKVNIGEFFTSWYLHFDISKRSNRTKMTKKINLAFSLILTLRNEAV